MTAGPAARTERQGLAVIGVGFGRTGTSSLRAALERLGFGPCYHMWEVIYNVERARQWRRIGEGEQPCWDEVYDGYASAVDWPGSAYWRELVDAYPHAKAVLTVRDPQLWYESARRTIFRFPLRRHNVVERLGYAMVARLNPAASEVPVMLDTVLWDRVFGSHPFDGRAGEREHAIRTFQRHIDEVTAYLPPERLLVLDVAEGWEPLCRFLGVAVPDEPFPQLNETEHFNQMLADRRWVAQRPFLLTGAGSVAAGVTAAAVAAANGLGGGTAALAGAAAAVAVAAGVAARRAARTRLASSTG